MKLIELYLSEVNVLKYSTMKSKLILRFLFRNCFIFNFTSSVLLSSRTSSIIPKKGSSHFWLIKQHCIFSNLEMFLKCIWLNKICCIYVHNLELPWKLFCPLFCPSGLFPYLSWRLEYSINNNQWLLRENIDVILLRYDNCLNDNCLN